MSFFLSSLILGLVLCALGWGIFLSLKVFNIPDITTDGSYTLGAAIAAVHLSNGGGWMLASILAIFSGALAGLITGIIHTRFKVNALLSGILVMTAAYSVNLAIMGKSNIPLINTANVFNSFMITNNQLINTLLVLLPLLLMLTVALVFLLKSDFGIAMRASGDSPEMAASMGVNVNLIKIIGLALANGLTALSGAWVAQYQNFTDINMGIGIVIFGLGAVMIGESLMQLLNQKSIPARILGVVLGCLIFRGVIALSLASGLDPNWLKAVTALIVLLFVALPGAGIKSLKR